LIGDLKFKLDFRDVILIDLKTFSSLKFFEKSYSTMNKCAILYQTLFWYFDNEQSAKRDAWTLFCGLWTYGVKKIKFWSFYTSVFCYYIVILKSVSKKQSQNIENYTKKFPPKKKVFKNLNTPPLDCIMDRHNNLLTNPVDITNKIHIQQSISNIPTIPTCHYLPKHPPHCTCVVRQYPWHNLDGFNINKRGTLETLLHNYFNKETYDICLKHLANNKNPGPDLIPNTILKNMPQCFHNLLFLFSNHCYKHKQILAP